MGIKERYEMLHELYHNSLQLIACKYGEQKCDMCDETLREFKHPEMGMKTCENCFYHKGVCPHCKFPSCPIGKPCEYCSENYRSQWRKIEVRK